MFFLLCFFFFAVDVGAFDFSVEAADSVFEFFYLSAELEEFFLADGEYWVVRVCLEGCLRRV